MFGYDFKFYKRLSCVFLIIIIYAFSSFASDTRNFSIKDNPFRYSGYYGDKESGMYYLNARYYSPELMRFINRDTYDLSNRYAYGNGNPISNTDPTGHSVWDVLGLGLGIVAAIGASIATGGVADALCYIGDGLASVCSAVGNGIHHQYWAMAGNILMAVGGAVGTYSAQPSMFASGRAGALAKKGSSESLQDITHISGYEEFNPESNEEVNNIIKMRTVYQTRSSYGSNTLYGLGAGFKSFQTRKNQNAIGLAANLGLDALSGFLGGYVYGKMSSGIDSSTPLGKAAGLGLKRTFVNGVIGSAGNVANDVIACAEAHDWSEFKSGDFFKSEGINLGTGAIFGALSGMLQVHVACCTNLDGSMNNKCVKFGRYFYLNTKAPVFGNLFAGTMSNYWSFNI